MNPRCSPFLFSVHLAGVLYSYLSHLCNGGTSLLPTVETHILYPDYCSQSRYLGSYAIRFAHIHRRTLPLRVWRSFLHVIESRVLDGSFQSRLCGVFARSPISSLFHSFTCLFSQRQPLFLGPTARTLRHLFRHIHLILVLHPVDFGGSELLLIHETEWAYKLHVT